MFKSFFLVFIFISFSFSLNVTQAKWQQGVTFLNYLENNSIPLKLYYDLDEDSQDLARMIFTQTDFFEVKDENGVLHYSLIPVSEDVGILIKKTDQNYTFEGVELDYQTTTETLSVKLQTALLPDIKKITGNSKLATEVSDVFNDIVDFKQDMRKNDQVSVIYERKVRLGATWGMPNVLAAFLETNKKKKYAFYNKEDEGYYDEKARPLKGMFLKYPMAFTRISSNFSLGRMHPILKVIRPHHGIDYVNKVGTPVKTVADGKIVYAGKKGGYGKTVIIQHKNGWRTLYAHLNGYSKNTRRGKRVKQGTVIAYMGNTGMSTGPHLHFGVYKKNKPFNPAKLKSVRKNPLSGKAKKTYLKAIESMKDQLLAISVSELSLVKRFALK